MTWLFSVWRSGGVERVADGHAAADGWLHVVVVARTGVLSGRRAGCGPIGARKSSSTITAGCATAPAADFSHPTRSTRTFR
ncbi:hypothetical protein EDD95_3575 [Streptomyces sp. CEV 2-1]|nr:hypothetical protein EDD95_3575 [Streptomyces sp. CEV 2-1]